MPSDKFKMWIKSYGAAKLSIHIGVHRTTIYSWLEGKSVPSDEHRVSILRLSKGKIKLHDIVDAYRKEPAPLAETESVTSPELPAPMKGNT